EPLEPEHARELLAVIGNKESALPLRVIVRKPINLVAQRNRHVALEGITQRGQGEFAVHADEQISHVRMGSVRIAPDPERHFPRFFGASAISAPRTRSSSLSAAPSIVGNSRSRPSIASTMASAMKRRANHLLSAGTTYQRALSRLVCLMASS